MKYKLKGIKGDKVFVQIVSQSKRNHEFNGSNRDFVFGNIILKSDQFPCYSKQKGIVFVRGKDIGKDLNLIEMPLIKFKEFEQAVEAYNEYWGEEE